MSAEITTLLRAAGAGDALAADRVFSLMYAELRQLAARRVQAAGAPTQLNPTALVHESYLRLQRAGGLGFDDRRHFMAYAARVMRSVVVDLVRARQAERRGGQTQFVTLDTAVAELTPQHDDDVLRVHEALDALAALEPRAAQVVEMRYFGGLSEPEIAQALDVTERTVQRDWAKARLFLATALQR